MMHDPIAKTGAWVKQMLKGHLNYFAVSGNHPSLWWFFNGRRRSRSATKTASASDGTRFRTMRGGRRTHQLRRRASDQGKQLRGVVLGFADGGRRAHHSVPSERKTEIETALPREML